MIIGVFLRNIKTYQGIKYIPLTNGDSFCGLVGNNGVGKSSVLESLDCFFNNRIWNLNIVTKKSGLESTNPYIVPVFLLKKTLFNGEASNTAELISSAIWNIEEKDIAVANRSNFKRFSEQINEIKKIIDISNYFLLPIGIDRTNKPNLNIFNCQSVRESLFPNGPNINHNNLAKEHIEKLELLIDSLHESIKYIYIPKEIDPETFTKLETKQIQVLMDKTLTQILETIVTSEKIKEINSSLKDFIKSLSKELQAYSYRTPTERQQNLRKADIYNLIIEAFFGIRKLHKKQGEYWLKIGDLSSGEKQKAIIDVAFNLLKRHHEGETLIIAVDEPTSSLHMSACFDQFNTLYEISRTTMQLLFASHWYGFLPVIEKGYVTVISKRENEHQFDLVNLEKYREEIKQKVRTSRGKLPYDIRLKSINDLVQSVVASTIGDSLYNWIICEGSSDKCYLAKYFEDILDNKKLRIIPVGGASEIKRLYQHISLAYADFKSEIKGKIVLLSDTDAQLVRYETQNSQNHPNLMCKRIVNCEQDRNTKLVTIDSNPLSPETEIEDVLNGKLFYEVLIDFKQDYLELLDFVDEEKNASEESSYFALDLRQSERDKLKQFFDRDKNKYEFASKYIERMNNNYAVPDWITEIKNFIT